MNIDWSSLAERTGSLTADGERGGTLLARKALEEVISETAIIEAIEFYVSGGLGAELARSVLCHIQPRTGMEYCFKVYNEDSSIDRRRSVIELLRNIADETVLPWIPIFLRDEGASIQSWGAGVLDQLTFKGLVSGEDCKDVLMMMENHENQSVRDLYVDIHEVLQS